MIAADTNVLLRYLLRYLLRDEEKQAEKARQLFMGDQPDLVTVVDKLLQDSNIRFEDEGVIWNALQSYRETDADFADALIVCKALKTAAASDEPCTVFTFDAGALQLPNTAEPWRL